MNGSAATIWVIVAVAVAGLAILAGQRGTATRRAGDPRRRPARAHAQPW
jgi:hypothetical protein